MLNKVILLYKLGPLNKQNYYHNFMTKQLIFVLSVLIVSLVVFHISQGSTVDAFDEYKERFGKVYQREGEEVYRRIIFMKNKERIERLNADPEETHLRGINRFTDLTLSEIMELYADLKVPSQATQNHVEEGPTRLGVEIDWEAAGKVTPVADQGQCGASWAFSASGAFQSAHMIKNNNIAASAQELLDCTGSYGNYGCNGGYMSSSFQYIKEKKLHEEKDYVYVGTNQKCEKPTGHKWTLSSYTEIVGCDNLLNALAAGPVSVAIDLSSIYDYMSGIVKKCGTLPSSGSLVIGVTDKYWRLKQSFSVNWGENGYIRLARGNTCAVCDMASYPTI